MYLGTLLTLAFLALRNPRAARLPRAAYLFALLVFFALWAGDGLNSLLSELRGAPFLYPPHNLLRLVTGTLMGLTLGSLLYMLLNSVIYRRLDAPMLFARTSDFFILLILAASLVVVIHSQWEGLLYPLTALLLVAIVGVHITVWTAVASSLARNALGADEIGRRLAIGAGVALVILNTLAVGRVLLGIALGVPL